MIQANRVRVNERTIKVFALGAEHDCLGYGPIEVGVSLPNGSISAQSNVDIDCPITDEYHWRKVPPFEIHAGTTIYVWAALKGDTYRFATQIGLTHPAFSDQSTWYQWERFSPDGVWAAGGGARHYVANIRFEIGRRDVERERQNQVIERGARGLSDKEIAKELNISIATVDYHWRKIRQRYGAASRTEAVAIWVREAARLQIEEFEASREAAAVQFWYLRRALDRESR